MTEDSGAFKTNSANSHQIPALCNVPGGALPRSLTGQGNAFQQGGGRSSRLFLTNAGKPLRYSEISLIRRARACPPRRERGLLVVTAFPMAQEPLQHPCEGGIRRFMLPGFRFLFA